MYPFCSILTPIQAVGIIIWYIVNEIINNDEEKWYKYSRGSLIMVLTQVTIVFIHTRIKYLRTIVGGSCLDFDWFELVDETNTILP